MSSGFRTRLRGLSPKIRRPFVKIIRHLNHPLHRPDSARFLRRDVCRHLHKRFSGAANHKGPTPADRINNRRKTGLGLRYRLHHRRCWHYINHIVISFITTFPTSWGYAHLCTAGARRAQPREQQRSTSTHPNARRLPLTTPTFYHIPSELAMGQLAFQRFQKATSDSESTGAGRVSASPLQVRTSASMRPHRRGSCKRSRVRSRRSRSSAASRRCSLASRPSKSRATSRHSPRTTYRHTR